MLSCSKPPIKSAATDTTNTILKGKANKYTSLTLAGLRYIMQDLTEYKGHMIIDDLGSEKTLWSRTSTITVLANLVHTHYVHKITHAGVLEITNFRGSAALNIQPVLMQSIVSEADWVAVIRDKVLRYYHLIRPRKPRAYLPQPEFCSPRKMPYMATCRVGYSFTRDTSCEQTGL